MIGKFGAIFNRMGARRGEWTSSKPPGSCLRGHGALLARRAGAPFNQLPDGRHLSRRVRRTREGQVGGALAPSNPLGVAAQQAQQRLAPLALGEDGIGAGGLGQEGGVRVRTIGHPPSD